MTAALGTLPFLATLWLLVVLGASVLEESGAKIAAALKGVPQQSANVVRMRQRDRARPARLRKHDLRWRAAA
jgi:hypothetical protein